MTLDEASLGRLLFDFCCDNLWKSKFMALEKPGKLGEFFLFYSVATLFVLFGCVVDWQFGADCPFQGL